MSVELHAIFKGRVQGVGFRWTVVDHAEKMGLSGCVRNLSNGDVELFAQGDKESLEELLKKIKNDSGSATITSVKTTYKAPVKSYHGFQITY